MKKLFFDIETRNTFEMVGKADPAMLDISCVCVYDSETNTYSSYLQEDLKKLWPLFEKADQLVTFNGDHFDIPLLNKYYSGNLMKMKSLDLLKEVRKALGHRIGLGVIAEGTLNKPKSGHGLEAIEWWKNGQIEKLIKYCLEDVKITKEIHDYALAHGKLKFRDKDTNQIIEFPIDTSEWNKKEEVKMTYSLPF